MQRLFIGAPQEIHHAKVPLIQELRPLLPRNGAAYDPKCLRAAVFLACLQHACRTRGRFRWSFAPSPPERHTGYCLRTLTGSENQSEGLADSGRRSPGDWGRPPEKRHHKLSPPPKGGGRNAAWAAHCTVSHTASVRHYIATQEVHHAKVPFIEELKRLLARNGVAYDAKYLE